MANETLPLLKGTLDLLVLKALTWEPMHGFGIASWLEQSSQGTLGVDDSAMYQALHRLEDYELHRLKHVSRAERQEILGYSRKAEWRNDASGPGSDRKIQSGTN